MIREINLDGGEISLLKKIGLSGGQMNGKLLVDALEDDEKGEFLETLSGLIDQDYLMSNKVNIRSIEDVERASFRVNPTHAGDLRDAVHPARRRERERQEQRERRRRRPAS
jgi:hypothetical protein